MPKTADLPLTTAPPPRPSLPFPADLAIMMKMTFAAIVLLLAVGAQAVS
jgi:uncharacterized RDD family membrane protein YckC